MKILCFVASLLAFTATATAQIVGLPTRQMLYAEAAAAALDTVVSGSIQAYGPAVKPFRGGGTFAHVSGNQGGVEVLNHLNIQILNFLIIKPADNGVTIDTALRDCFGRAVFDGNHTYRPEFNPWSGWQMPMQQGELRLSSFRSLVPNFDGGGGGGGNGFPINPPERRGQVMLVKQNFPSHIRGVVVSSDEGIPTGDIAGFGASVWQGEENSPLLTLALSQERTLVLRATMLNRQGEIVAVATSFQWRVAGVGKKWSGSIPLGPPDPAQEVFSFPQGNYYVTFGWPEGTFPKFKRVGL
ncbi:MAG: hypothetical protein V4467_00490 [Patescibacteria group bacterium]